MTIAKQRKSVINVGVDVGKSKLDVCIYEKSIHFQESNDASGISRILKRLACYQVERLGIAIYLYLNRTLNKEQLDKIKTRIENQFKVIETLSVDEHFTTNVECPLLASGLCSVYKVRPISCAGYHSVSEEACRKSNDNPEIVSTENGGIPLVGIIKEEQSIQNTIAIQVIDFEKDDGEQYELIRALHQLFKKPSRIQRWKKGRKLF